MTMRLRLDICYDGTDFSGWAVQPGRRTVAGVIGTALAVLFREPIPIVVAGRTDAGVHALGQVAHVDVPEAGLLALTPRYLGHAAESDAARPATDGLIGAGDGPEPEVTAALVGLRRRLAGLLPPDVRVPSVAPAPAGFDARFAALRRHYRYRISCSDWGMSPLGGRDVLPRRRALDSTAMHLAAQGLVGLHDFAAYCKPREGGTTIRHLQSLTVTAAPTAIGAGEDLVIDVTADAFCHSMVRGLVGALIAVGEGRFEVTRPAELLAQRRRTAEIAVAPARGLTLMAVDYPPDDELAARAAATRALRSADDCACGETEG